MICIGAPRKYHLFVLSQCALMCWVATVITWTTRKAARKLTLADLVVSLWPKSISWSLKWILSHSGSCSTTPWRSCNYIMECTTVNLANFGVKKSEDHLRCRYRILSRSFLAVVWVFVSVISSVIWLNIEIRHCLLLTTELSKIISPHRVYKTTWSKQKTML